ncbi:uncharacterized protein LOC131253718 isoform X4 [Magnolia sinica]|uniref:uncharacterized protein LOC131253718 isoform X4 n=1 Tax=Magnolia sinica TaxID=86752 RepID=UPI00265A4EBF|nr:uncharacterized protein LOC131253718 isoform X4 [Magnolia sinica]
MLRAVTSRLSTNILHRINIDRHLRCGIEVSRCCYCYSTGLVPFQNEDSDSQKIVGDECNSRAFTSSEVRHGNQAKDQYSKNARDLRNFQIGENVSRKDKMNFLVKTEAKELVIWQLFDLKDSKEAVYSALDAWVAWEQNFPIVSLKRALITLEKEEQWHRIIQVLKWMLSKGQGTTRGTYGQLIRALDKDRRAEEAHNLWVKKISHDLHSVPWQLCHLMISIYYRNNMPERLVKRRESKEGHRLHRTNAWCKMTALLVETTWRQVKSIVKGKKMKLHLAMQAVGPDDPYNVHARSYTNCYYSPELVELVSVLYNNFYVRKI